LLIEADATDPAAGSFALAAFSQLATTALRDDLKGPLAMRAPGHPPFNAVQHLLYNPESITQYNIVPGLLAIILTMSMVLLTCLRSRGNASGARMRTCWPCPPRRSKSCWARSCPTSRLAWCKARRC
jgi:ABC-2 type transport system permease protein